MTTTIEPGGGQALPNHESPPHPCNSVSTAAGLDRRPMVVRCRFCAVPFEQHETYYGVVPAHPAPLCREMVRLVLRRATPTLPPDDEGLYIDFNRVADWAAQ